METPLFYIFEWEHKNIIELMTANHVTQNQAPKPKSKW